MHLCWTGVVFKELCYMHFSTWYWPHILGMGNISILSYIVILRAHDKHIVVFLQLSSYRLHIISGAFT